MPELRNFMLEYIHLWTAYHLEVTELIQEWFVGKKIDVFCQVIGTGLRQLHQMFERTSNQNYVYLNLIIKYLIDK